MVIQLGSAYGTVELDAKGVKRGVSESQTALGGLEKSFNDVFKFSLGGLVAQGIGQLIGGLRDTGREVRELSTGFESEMAIMSTAVDPTVASIESLSDAAMAVGGDISLVGIDAQQSAGAMTGLFKSGMSVNDVFGDMQGYMEGTAKLGGVLRGSIDLQAASALDLEAAASLVNATLATYQLETSEASRVTDNFVQTADASQAEVEDLAMAHQNAAIVLASFGYTLEDTNTALALMSENALKGAEAGTSLRAMVNQMLRPTEKTKEAWQELNIALYDGNGQLKTMPQLIGELVPALKNVSEERRNELVYLLAGADGQRALNILLSKGVDGWREMEAAIAGAATAQEVAAARTNTLQGAQEALEGTLDTLKIRVGTEFMPVWLEMTKGFTALVDEHGPQVVAIMGQIADAILSAKDGLGQIDPALVNTAIQITGLVTTLGVGRLAFLKLAPVVGSLGTVLSEAVVGMQLYAGGASLAEVASLGWSAALGPLAVGVAAVTLALVAVNKAIQFHNELQEQAAEVTDAWSDYLGDVAAETSSATSVANAYVRKQQEINKTLNESNQVVASFIDKQKVLNADTDVLNTTLAQSATSYDDYRQAVDVVNEGVRDAATWTNRWGEELFNEAVYTQNAIVPLERYAYMINYAGGQAQDSLSSFQQYSQAIAGAEVAAAAAVPHINSVADAERNVAAMSQEMADQVAGAWQTFAENVRTGVAGALEAYQAGNEEMLAEQQRQLGQMLLGQTDQMLALGQITNEQAMTMRGAVAEEFGIMVDDVELTTGRLLALYNDWSVGGQTSADEIVAFIVNIGEESATLADEEEVRIGRQIKAWELLNTAGGETADMMMGHMQHLGIEVGTATEGVETGFGQMGSGAVRMAGEVGESVGEAITTVDNLATAIENLPEYTHIEIEVERTGDDAWDFGSPNFRFYYALERLVDYAEDNSVVIDVASRMDGGVRLDNPSALFAPLTQMTAPAAGGGGQTSYDQRQVHVTVPVTAMQDELDLELLARRVVALIQSRQ